MATPVAAVTVTPTPLETGPVAAAAGGTSDFAALLAARFDGALGSDTLLPVALAEAPADDAEAMPGLDLAALFGSAPAIAVALPGADPKPDAEAATGVAGVGNGSAKAASVTELLQSLGSARQGAKGDADLIAAASDETAAARFAAAELPPAANPAAAADAAAIPDLRPSGHAAAAMATDSARTAPPRVDTPLADARWASDFSQKIVWMARQDLQSAQISLNPPNLGPIDVSLQLGPDQATAVFSSPHAEVREALESALPRLREMLAGAGISLGQAQVGSQAQQQAGNSPGQAGARSLREVDGSILSSAVESGRSQALRHSSGMGLVDTFA